MRRPVDAADPARHVLLGLLLDGPSHGYILARAFAPGTALGSVVYLGASHLYALLIQLERDGFIEGERLEQGARPARRVYRITDAGRAEVLRWIDEPVGRPRDVLIDFPLKLYLAQRLDTSRALNLVMHQRNLFASYLKDLEHEIRQTDSAKDQSFLSLVLDGRIERTKSTLAWLEHCASALAVQPTAK
ncbi:MAG: PadR family transcriptional regulator [Chloroflexi bacterium]|jgi:DNA-binding PadR family transcriptional regulator|nr:PadR family transcriptional regulator [Chloroflexota bacterium]